MEDLAKWHNPFITGKSYLQYEITEDGIESHLPLEIMEDLLKGCHLPQEIKEDLLIGCHLLQEIKEDLLIGYQLPQEIKEDLLIGCHHLKERRKDIATEDHLIQRALKLPLEMLISGIKVDYFPAF